MAHRYRIYPTQAQADVFVQHCTHARVVWNAALEQMGCYQPGRSVNMGAWDRQLTEARQEFPWLADGSSSVQQASLRDLRQAFANWWTDLKKPPVLQAGISRPTWRKAHRGNQGFCIRDLKVRVLSKKWAEINVPKCGPVRFRLSRKLPEGAKSARVTLDRSGRWHVSVVALQPEFLRETTGEIIGLDLGIKRTVTLSTGGHLDMPALLSTGEERRRLRLQRRLARQEKGSRRRDRTKRSLAQVAAREADRRKDWIEKTTTDLIRDFDVIAIEALKVKNMLSSAKGTTKEPGRNVRAKAGLNRGIAAQGWGMFRQRLEQKATVASAVCIVVAVNPAWTSQTCSQCGGRHEGSRESQAVFKCRGCGHEANADVNAALNILAAGLAVTGRGGHPDHGPCEPSTTRVPVAA